VFSDKNFVRFCHFCHACYMFHLSDFSWERMYILHSKLTWLQTQVRPLRGRAIAQAVISRFLTEEARVRAQVSPCGICAGQSGTVKGLSPSQCNFTAALYSLVYHLGDGQWDR
jgi:hypothetical protein